ncbi:hypothetical protein KFK09_026180 [Dendrobium nobile]|uniref:Uncharacterized protein n=1 Tax=Dendrobium nobile TaxID=94219 RepID=A0A8T3A709_DENNO|nr:hypothetical protein KFK09_026180 [Dendrobium nobile]
MEKKFNFERKLSSLIDKYPTVKTPIQRSKKVSFSQLLLYLNSLLGGINGNAIAYFSAILCSSSSLNFPRQSFSPATMFRPVTTSRTAAPRIGSRKDVAGEAVSSVPPMPRSFPSISIFIVLSKLYSSLTYLSTASDLVLRSVLGCCITLSEYKDERSLLCSSDKSFLIIFFQLHPNSCSPDLERLLYSSNAEIFDLLVFTEIRNQDLHQFLTFVLRYVDKSFNNQFKPTINADFLTKELQIEGKLVALQIWDTPGREKFHNLAVPYYRGADGCILVYDINSKKSFEALDKWYSLFMEQANPSYVSDLDHNKFPFLLLGNKIDADHGVLRQVSDKAAIDWCVAKGDIPYYETSAKEGCNIEAAFLSIAQTALASQHEKHTIYFTASSSEAAYEQEQRSFRGRWFCCYY